jgi:hypothetical protein
MPAFSASNPTGFWYFEGLDLLTTICIGNLYLFEGFKKKVLDGQEISRYANGVNHQTDILAIQTM